MVDHGVEYHGEDSEGNVNTKVVDATFEVVGEGDLNKIAGEIKVLHEDTLDAATNVVQAAARAGEKLIEARAALESQPKHIPFTTWVKENLKWIEHGKEVGISWRTAYNYIAVAEAMSRHGVSIESCTSIREVLKLISNAKGADGGSDKPRDPVLESYVTHAQKIENFFRDAFEKEPLETWSESRRETAKKLLAPVAKIHRLL